MWNALVWHKREANGGFFVNTALNFKFHKILFFFFRTTLLHHDRQCCFVRQSVTVNTTCLPRSQTVQCSAGHGEVVWGTVGPPHTQHRVLVPQCACMNDDEDSFLIRAVQSRYVYGMPCWVCEHCRTGFYLRINCVS
jgi:hypothetical protein